MKKLWNELLWNFTATANVCIKYWCGDDVFGGEMRRKNLFASNICVQHLRKKYIFILAGTDNHHRQKQCQQQ